MAHLVNVLNFPGQDAKANYGTIDTQGKTVLYVCFEFSDNYFESSKHVKKFGEETIVYDFAQAFIKEMCNVCDLQMQKMMAYFSIESLKTKDFKQIHIRTTRCYKIKVYNEKRFQLDPNDFLKDQVNPKETIQIYLDFVSSQETELNKECVCNIL